MQTHAAQRGKERVVQLANAGLDLATFWQEASRVIARVVPHYYTPCWYTLDPGSLLVTSHFHQELPEIPAEWLAHEYLEDGSHKMADVARSASGISTLHDATQGDPRRSPSWELYLEPYGAEQEAYIALRTRAGEPWGLLSLYREIGAPLFSAEELGFLRELSPFLAEGARRGLLLGEASDPEGPEAPGLVILREDWTVESLTPGVAQWLDDLPDSEWTGRSILPPAVMAVAGRALRTTQPAAPGEVAFARVLSRSGRWVVLHGAAMVADGARRVAVIVEPAHPARIATLLMAAYGLTEREQDVTRLVLQGNSTSEIATQLRVTPQTVQQHLKSIFDKTSVRSRRELVGKVFFAHYEPRVRDNEQRSMAGKPLRGGPLPSTAQAAARPPRPANSP